MTIAAAASRCGRSTCLRGYATQPRTDVSVKVSFLQNADGLVYFSGYFDIHCSDWGF